MNKILGLTLQIGAMLTDLLLVFCLLVVGFNSSWLWAFIMFLIICNVQKDIGGWFSAWRPKHIKTFWAEWKKI